MSTEKPTTLEIGPHDLVIQQGDCYFTAYCSCGVALDGGDPTMSFDRFGEAWERHVMTEHRDCDCEVCQL